MTLKMALSFVMIMISILFNTIDAKLLLNPPKAKTEAELVEMSGRFDTYELDNEITVIKSSNLSGSEIHSVIILQGLVAKEKPSLFIDHGYDANDDAIAEFEKILEKDRLYALKFHMKAVPFTACCPIIFIIIYYK